MCLARLAKEVNLTHLRWEEVENLAWQVLVTSHGQSSIIHRKRRMHSQQLKSFHKTLEVIYSPKHSGRQKR